MLVHQLEMENTIRGMAQTLCCVVDSAINAPPPSGIGLIDALLPD